MRKLILMVGLIVVGIACGDAVGEMMDSGVPDAGAQPTPTPVGKFVGYTSEGVRRQNISDKRPRLLRDGSWFWPRPHGRPGTPFCDVAS
jgi:hypothetical protein